ncbi:uncharacterized protein LOC131335578 [Rhododendron vialii]|uniref:uncharacterized protein LOC131335578 n=1 Tax=Rhododendron vialii TaxID=182163 RepID=UPI00265DDB32|nr:uncharacterized protein LOC131335578 [Rhododendron vialii]
MAAKSNEHAVSAQVQESSGKHPGGSKSKAVTKQGGQQSIVQQTSTAEYEDKVTGSSERHTATVSSKQRIVETSTGGVVITDQQRESSTVKNCDKSGCTMYQHSEQKTTQVNFDNSGNTSCRKNK